MTYALLNADRLEGQQAKRQKRIAATLVELERLSVHVNRVGWASTSGAALLNLMLNQLQELMADVDMLKVKAERFE